MEARRRTWFDDRGLTVATADGGSRPLPFYAGAYHYWRAEPAQWAPCLRALHGLGLTIVESYVPWRVHERAAGRYDFGGARDLRRFLDAAHTAGLSVVLRPGPHCNAELTAFGLPGQVLADAACLARTSRDTPAWLPAPPRAFPIPSYAAAAFQARVRAWYAAVAEVVRPALAPDGPVVALGVDNEAPMFFRLGAFDLDYHPDALAWWTAWSGFADAPRAWDAGDAARCVRWVQFKEHYAARALGKLAAMLDEVGLGDVARFHNLPAFDRAIGDARGIGDAIAGPVGIDAYAPREALTAVRRRAVGVPFAFEAGVGWTAFQPPLDRQHSDAHRERDQLLALLAAGVRGFNVYMAVARDRWYGAAIDRGGVVTADAAWIRTLTAALGELDWPGLRPLGAGGDGGGRLALVATRADARFGLASNAVDPVSPVVAELFDLGPVGAAELGSDRGAVLARRWHDAIVRALELAQVPYTVVDEAAPVSELAAYRAVIVPTLERVDRGLWQRVHALADQRTAVVVIGPGSPSVDELGQALGEAAAPPRRVGRIRAASLDDLPGLAADLAALAGEGGDSWQIERPDDVRAFAFADRGGAVRVVFVCSDSPRAATAVLYTDADAAALRDPFSREVLCVSGGKATVPMPARGVRMLIVE